MSEWPNASFCSGMMMIVSHESLTYFEAHPLSKRIRAQAEQGPVGTFDNSPALQRRVRA